MKKITLLLALLTISFGYSQAPTGAAPTPPAREAADVISIFTQTVDATTTVYNDLAVANFNPDWGSTSGNVTIDPQGGDRALTYPNFDYQGIIIGQNVNVSAMTTLHVDIWTNSVSPNVYLISNSTEEQFVNVPAAPNQWTSVEIDLSAYSNQGVSLNDIKELKFATDLGPSGVTIYIDNIYFSRPPVDPAADATLSNLSVDGTTISGFGSSTLTYTYEVSSATPIPQLTATTTQAGASATITQAATIPGSGTVVVTSQDASTTNTYTVNFVITGPTTAAPTPPNRPAADVKSIFSDAYAPIATLNYAGEDNQPSNDNTYNTSWCGATTELVQIAGNNTNKVTGLGCEGIAFLSGRFDASTFTNFHIDIYTDSPTMDASFNIKFSNWNGGTMEANALEFSFTNASTPALPSSNPGTWISFDVPFSAFTPVNGASRNDFVQFIITSNLGTVYYDNLYVHKNTLGINEFDNASFNVFPNPSRDSWTVKTKDIAMSSIQVFDVLGKSVMTITPNSSETVIDGSNLKTGLYFARITTNGNINTVKLIKD